MRRSPVGAAVFIRSAAFNLAFYLMTAACLILPLPVYFILPQGFAMWVVRTWAKIGLFLLRAIAGTRIEIRGRENLPRGGILVAAKHQSALETFALIPLFANPTYVMKRQLRWLPIFGQYTIKAGMIHVDRDGGLSAMRKLTTDTRAAIDAGREVIIFPEGTRRPPGAPSEYHGGAGHLYRALKAPVVPLALNSGLYRPRRKFMRYPGTVVFEFLPPIPAGLDSRAFLSRLADVIETASDRLLLEADGASPRPPFPQSAEARLALIRKAPSPGEEPLRQPL